jgi:hypothetical protein
VTDILRYHLSRVEGATIKRLRMRDLPQWIEQNTTINGRPYRFKDHEYQERIMGDESQEVVIRKCSQVGISEMSIRMALGLARLMPAYSTIYTFPTAKFAEKYVRTRVDPVIEGSADLSAAIASDVDSSQVKRLGRFGYVYFGGASSSNAAISVMADHLIHDELDFSDMEVISQFHSRLTHSPFKRKTKLSTPTVPGGPIDYEFLHSKRWWNMVKCSCCNHSFVPDYYQHVHIPDYGRGEVLRRITKESLHTLRYKEAVVICPRCDKLPSLQPEHREWVCENPSENYLATGYQVQPFDAPNLIPPSYLVESSTQYERRTDFDNFALGKPAEDADSGLQPSDIEAAGVEMDKKSPFHTHIIGFDQGIICRLFVAGITQEGVMVLVHSEQIPIQDLRRRYRELCIEYRVISKVGDAQPYIETIMSLQEQDANLYAAFFVRKEKLELYVTHTREENIEQGKTSLRDVQINRNKALDMLMEDVRSGMVKIRRDENWADIKAQCTDMKRIKMLNSENEFVYNWIKSAKKNEHFHMAMLYCWIAKHLRGTAQSITTSSIFGVHKFKIADKVNRLPGEKEKRPMVQAAGGGLILRR